MADGITIPVTGSGDATPKVATDDTGATGHVQIVKLAVAADGSVTFIDADGNGLKVQLGAALPAGNNNVGDVDVATLPADPLGVNADAVVAAGAAGSLSAKLRRATQGLEDLKSLIVLAAGNNNIGDVDVATVPADPFGAIADAIVAAGATGSFSAKLRRVTQGLEDLKTAIVLSGVPADPFGANADAAVAAGATGSIQAKLRRLTQGLEDLKTLTVLAAGSNTIGNVGNVPLTSGGLSTYRKLSAASTNGANVKASGGQVYLIVATNINAAVRYLKLYDKATSPTVGTDTPLLTIAIPGNTAGAGIVVPIMAGLAFASGIGVGITTGIADADTGAVAANDLIVQLGYK